MLADAACCQQPMQCAHGLQGVCSEGVSNELERVVCRSPRQVTEARLVLRPRPLEASRFARVGVVPESRQALGRTEELKEEGTVAVTDPDLDDTDVLSQIVQTPGQDTH